MCPSPLLTSSNKLSQDCQSTYPSENLDATLDQLQPSTTTPRSKLSTSASSTFQSSKPAPSTSQSSAPGPLLSLLNFVVSFSQLSCGSVDLNSAVHGSLSSDLIGSCSVCPDFSAVFSVGPNFVGNDSVVRLIRVDDHGTYVKHRFHRGSRRNSVVRQSQQDRSRTSVGHTIRQISTRYWCVCWY